MQTSEFLGQIILGRWSTKFENLKDSPCVWEKEREREREREGFCEIAATAWLISATNQEHTILHPNANYYCIISSSQGLTLLLWNLLLCLYVKRMQCFYVAPLLRQCKHGFWKANERYWLAWYMNMNRNFCTQLERGLERRLTLWNKVKGKSILGFDAHGACDHIKYARLPISPHQSKVSLYLRYCVQGEHWASPDRKWVNHNLVPYQ